MTKRVNNPCSFKDVCRLISMAHEYPGYHGPEKWLLISALSEEEIMGKYTDEVKPYIPFIYMNRKTFSPIAESHHNDRKHEIRASNYCDAYAYEDGVFEAFHPELIHEGPDANDWSSLYEALEQLTPVQRARIQKKYFLKLTMIEIAAQEGTTKQAVEKSIKKALVSLRRILSQDE